MKKVKLLQTRTIQNKTYNPGDTLELEDSKASFLVARKEAVLVKDPEEKPKTAPKVAPKDQVKS